MPNVEIHGLDYFEAMELTTKVIRRLAGESSIDDPVVEIYPTKVLDTEGKSRPFFRLHSCGTWTDEGIIIPILEEFCLDIEILPPLKSFHPRRPRVRYTRLVFPPGSFDSSTTPKKPEELHGPTKTLRMPPDWIGGNPI